jgi:hypothetical protein
MKADLRRLDPDLLGNESIALISEKPYNDGANSQSCACSERP